MSHAFDISVLYDHEEEGAFGAGRRRAAHDWGADDLFDGSRPSRRRFVHDADRRAGRDRPVADWFADDERRRVDEWLAGGGAPAPATDTDEAEDGLARELPQPEAPTLELDLPLGETRPARRTVTVTGHPDAVRRAQRAGEIARRRPAPTLDARIGHRPDRVAMWACALGLLLVVIAIATGGA